MSEGSFFLGVGSFKDMGRQLFWTYFFIHFFFFFFLGGGGGVTLVTASMHYSLTMYL